MHTFEAYLDCTSTPAVWSLNYSLEFWSQIYILSYWLVWTWFLLLAFKTVQNEWENILLSVLKVLRQSASLKIACVVLSHSYSQSTEKGTEVTVTLQVSQLEVISESKKKENWEADTEEVWGWMVYRVTKEKGVTETGYFPESEFCSQIYASLSLECSIIIT